MRRGGVGLNRGGIEGGERIELKCAVLTVFYSSLKCNVSWLSLSPTQLRTQEYFRS
jgi:hypothetical protein